jgi:hypothetical protein
VETVILLSMHNQTDTAKVLRDAAQSYKVGIDAISATVRQEFAATNKASTAKAINSAAELARNLETRVPKFSWLHPRSAHPCAVSAQALRRHVQPTRRSMSQIAQVHSTISQLSMIELFNRGSMTQGEQNAKIARK